jgi:hypothetical protein
MLEGHVAFWTPLLGLGVPQPFVPTFTLHPLTPLLAAMSPMTWARALLAAHTIAGAIGMWQLARRVGTSPLAAGLCACTFLLSSPTQNYAIVQFWPSHYLVWTTAPWLLLLAWRLLDADRAALRRWSVALGLLAALVLANTNPGHVVVYAVAVGAVAVTRWRDVVARGRWLLASGVIAAIGVAPTLAQLWHERPFFAPDLGVANLPEPIPGFGVLTVFLAPLGTSDEELRLARLLFFGGPFALLAIAGAVRRWRQHPDLVLTMVIGLALAFTSLGPTSIISARYQFRDPVILAAIPLAGLALDRLLTRRRRAGALAIALQLVVLCVAIHPAARRAWVADARGGEWFRGATAATEGVDRLSRLMTRSGRLAYAPYVDEEVYEGRLHVEGLGTNALAYRGIPVVNGWFKAVSAGTVSPDERMFYGRVRVPEQALRSPGVLDVLGIRYVLARPEDAVAEGLQPRGSIPRKLAGEFVLYENTDAWAGAFLARANVEQAILPLLDGCAHDRLLCRNVAALADYRLPDAVHLAAEGDRMTVRVLPATEPRVLVVTQMFRPDWIASAGEAPLETVPVAGALLGVRVPPGATSITLRYRPWAVMLASALAVATLVSCAVLLLVRGRAGAASA